ncbi:hypothetical protein EYZ11_006136 [Aspergillus tanneri]|uniref:Uncharacterized protein n=1 Tax=Aspergillus tanneri TaxID=1220188 RepID=A0A4S3JGR8_9EURO|nr:hypothetical protein EYZ11_006136 [Aspergillus tanneri]
MEPLTLQVQHGQEEAIECWDNDGDLQCYEDIQLRTASSATSVTNSSIRLSGHRDSISSRRSARSDIDSTGGGDEDWQVQLLDDEESVNEEALASAKIAGIPLPKSIPRSALVGGIIRRLGPRRTRDDFVDDWSDDVEFPDPDVVLELKSPQVASFPESLQQIGSTTASPVKAPASPCWSNNVTVRLRSAIEHSDGSRVDCDAGDVEGIPTIRPTLSRPPQRTSVINDSMLIKERDATRVFEDFEEDIELPQDDFLRLPSRKVGNARSSSPCPEDFDVEFSEGSIGVRFGGTARDHRSNPSSSLVSPSVSSYLTGESDDEGLDGLVIPEGPLDLDKSMRKRHESSTLNMMIPESAQATQDPTELEDFFSGFELESDNMFDTRRLSINPNVKCKTDRIGSPGRRILRTLKLFLKVVPLY